MKKSSVALFVFFLILIAFLYLFIPNSVSINQEVFIKSNAQGIYRNLGVENNWKQWWPGTIDKSDNLNQIFKLNSYTYTVTDKSVSNLFILIKGNHIAAKTLLHVIPLKPDSIKLIWGGKILTSKNPVKRIQKYFEAKALKKEMKKIIGKMDEFFSDNANIYGIPIKQELVVDSILVSTNAVSTGYPDTEFISNRINKLKNYIRSQSAKETGYPMLNVSTSDSINFLTKVAIPVNKRLKDSGSISYKWMLGGGKILVTEIKGGPHSIKEGFTKMEYYVNDYKRVAPAIPFQSLLTDRMKEPDTSKWITRIFYPVM